MSNFISVDEKPMDGGKIRLALISSDTFQQVLNGLEDRLEQLPEVLQSRCRKMKDFQQDLSKIDPLDVSKEEVALITRLVAKEELAADTDVLFPIVRKYFPDREEKLAVVYFLFHLCGYASDAWTLAWSFVLEVKEKLSVGDFTVNADDVPENFQAAHQAVMDSLPM